MEDRPGTAEGFALAGGYSVVFRTPDAELPGVYSTLYWKVDRALDITQLKLMAIAEAMGKADSMAKDGKIAKATIKIFTDDQTAIRWIDRVENFRWWLTEPVDTKCLLRRAVAPILNTIAMLSKTLRDEHGSYVEFHSAGNELLHEAIAPVVLAKSAAARACENTGPTTITNSRCQATKNLDAEVIALADAIVP
ncbi:hypothetical protein B0T17DRAFT_620608 [Bombardia bombarda]|uniref:Uncharacterized protein n=1 Tax=Bombardia bombarda TaxID=252184 RepID=A0AA39T287_9PEZI|nr:hypothetical protein B0T17DRAFT_620608 [Bombardia bombarda]